MIRRQRNDPVFLTLCDGPLRQGILEALHDYGNVEWKRTLKDLEKAPDVSYEDVLKGFDST